jgi:hypothetical protein
MGRADETSETSDASGSEAARRLSLRVGGLRSKHTLRFLLTAGEARRQKVQNRSKDEVI